MIGNLIWFAIAAGLEIGGCFAFWIWTRREGSPWLGAVGVLALVGFAFALTRVDTPFAGRAYAAYGGIYIVSSLCWLWVVERQTPTTGDTIGAVLSVLGAVVILTSPGDKAQSSASRSENRPSDLLLISPAVSLSFN